ncbi:MAG: 1-deoxy-D-xylulose-5-phosphate synthase [Actinobacteria bacterium]|nr:1-deoxy-D-xylulose-5-phosphate synthase [Actinomycetota bacterium]MCB9412722.1 1-deoxy-D-xylulose-5-phosphate synthase [Actinomycetota bacterium]
MTRLDDVTSPADIAGLDYDELDDLAAQIRTFLVQKVSRTGGHLGPNLGVVELTLALHRVFDSPTDALLWDTGHQSYVHKIVTGRASGFDTLRQPGGLSGYPSRSESPHDIIENSHASTALSWADGLAKAYQARGELGRRKVVAIIGDGALTGGMAWEALNNIAGADRQVIIVVNDNERSYSPTIGGLADHLATLRTTDGYERFLDWGRRVVSGTPIIGRPAYGTLHGVKKGLKDMVAPQGMFEDLGLKYIGPVDGHNIADLETALQRARAFNGPVIVHAITEKGRGYAPAEADDADRFHGVGQINPDTGVPLAAAGATWTGAFASELLDIARKRPDVVAITAAMPGPTGLVEFSQEFPDRFFDVGIAEQHAATSAAGMAYGGLHPVVALYATFLNRAFDQVLMDCALHRQGVTFALDRSGVTGDDGASHNGMWDLSMLSFIPGVRVAAPRDEQRLREQLRTAVTIDDAPSVVRYPKGALPAPIPTVEVVDGLDVIYRSEDVGQPDTAPVVIVSIGALAGECVGAGEKLAAEHVPVVVVDPGWVLPVPAAVVALAHEASLVVTVEDGNRRSGAGAAVTQRISDAGVRVPGLNLGIPSEFLDVGKRSAMLADFGLTAEGIAASVQAARGVGHPGEVRA